MTQRGRSTPLTRPALECRSIQQKLFNARRNCSTAPCSTARCDRRSSNSPTDVVQSPETENARYL